MPGLRVSLPLTPLPPSPAMQMAKLPPVPSHILRSRSLCCRPAPRRAGGAGGRSLSEAFSVGQSLNGAARVTVEHRTPSVLERVERAEAGYCGLPPKLASIAAAMLYAITRFLSLLPWYFRLLFL